jgi:hypothetical protein
MAITADLATPVMVPIQATAGRLLDIGDRLGATWTLAGRR